VAPRRSPASEPVRWKSRRDPMRPAASKDPRAGNSRWLVIRSGRGRPGLASLILSHPSCAGHSCARVSRRCARASRRCARVSRPRTDPTTAGLPGNWRRVLTFNFSGSVSPTRSSAKSQKSRNDPDSA
jgi:hypothetical protein